MIVSCGVSNGDINHFSSGQPELMKAVTCLHLKAFIFIFEGCSGYGFVAWKYLSSHWFLACKSVYNSRCLLYHVGSCLVCDIPSYYLNICISLYLFVCSGGTLCRRVCMEVRRQLVGVVLSFLHVVPGDGTQVVSLRGKCLHTELSQLPFPPFS